ncbi:uncharacterized protein [Nicotiana sylvestris]|uniref:Uncharacterized protein LOC104236667 n=1 Tax=Nicotiana sylvestris TaxID=4096 RepID=A0A1U7XDK0_NICSY|nr:PREDICTED: uncharacterized protein LOC104236667 [Nicotiana sylvestris]
MWLQKWSPDFKPEEDLPIVPAWVLLPRLPFHMHDWHYVKQLLSSVRTPLALDAATIGRTRPSMAKIRVEVDLLKTLPQSVFVGQEYEDSPLKGYTQKLEYEGVPKYFKHCRKIGHYIINCRVLEKKKLKIYKKKRKRNKIKVVRIFSKSENKKGARLMKVAMENLQSCQVWKSAKNNNMKNSNRKKSAATSNIKGVRSKKVIHRLKKLININNSQYVAIFEPFVSNDKLEGYRKFLDFQHCCSNNIGQIWYFWNSYNTTTVTAISEQHITIHFQNIFGKDIYIFAVYAKGKSKDRRDLWHSFELDSMVIDTPWCVGGDFNIIMDPNKKLGGQPHRMYRSLEFQTCISNCGLIDMGYNGSNYTWCNNRRSGKKIWKRLDRIFVNDLWDQLFQRTSVSHLARTSSDHRPLLMKNLSATHQYISYFRFLNCWVNIEGFLDIVRESWSTEVSGNPIWILQSKLKALSKRLSQWSRKEIGDINDAVINWEDKL